MKEKNKNRLIWFLVPIIVSLLGLIVFLGKDKILKNKNNNTTTTTTTTNKIVTNYNNKVKILDGECYSNGDYDSFEVTTYLNDKIKYTSNVDNIYEGGKIYINNKIIVDGYNLIRVCAYNKYILIGIGEGGAVAYDIYNSKGEDLLEKAIRYYEIKDNIITGYSSLDNNHIRKVVIDLSKDKINTTMGKAESYSCPSDNPYGDDTTDLKEKVINYLCSGV